MTTDLLCSCIDARGLVVICAVDAQADDSTYVSVWKDGLGEFSGGHSFLVTAYRGSPDNPIFIGIDTDNTRPGTNFGNPSDPTDYLVEFTASELMDYRPMTPRSLSMTPMIAMPRYPLEAPAAPTTDKATIEVLPDEPAAKTEKPASDQSPTTGNTD